MKANGISRANDSTKPAVLLRAPKRAECVVKGCTVMIREDNYRDRLRHAIEHVVELEGQLERFKQLRPVTC